MKFIVKAKLNNPERIIHGKEQEFLLDSPELSERLKEKGWEKISSRKAVKGKDWDYLAPEIFGI